MKKLLLLSAIFLSTSALAAPAPSTTANIIGYDVQNAAPSGTAFWLHDYGGTITDLGNGLKDYTGGTGTLADGTLSNSVRTTQLFRSSDNTSITVFLDGYYNISSVSLFGGPDNDNIPGQITQATFSFPSFSAVKSSTPFGVLSLASQPVNDRFDFITTSPFVNQFTISNFVGSYYDPTYDDNFFSISEIQIAVSPIPEPSTYALMLGGLGLVGFMAARRRRTA